MVDLSSVFITSVETAVGTSVGQSRPLIVYITDSSDNADAWINDLITPGILDSISQKAVALRLVKNSSECQMFEQIFPNVIVPSIFCIRVSSILDIIHGDVDKDTFKTRLERVLYSDAVNQANIEQPSHTQEHTSDVLDEAITSQDTTRETVSPSVPVREIIQEPVQPPQSESEPQQDVSSSEAEPAAPVHSQSPNVSTSPNKKPEADSKESKSTNTSSTPRPSKFEQKTLKEQAAQEAAIRYKQEQLKRAKTAREERERVRRLLKADEEERKLNARHTHEERERKRRLSNNEESDDEHKIDEIIHEHESLKDNVHQRKPSSSQDFCALSLRLLDGTSLRESFKATDTLHVVREWVDANRTDGDEPYCFHRTIPRLTFGVIDEEKTLESLQLTPRSALILKPYTSYTTAYGGHNTQASTSSSFFSRIFGGVSSLWSGKNYTPAEQYHSRSNDRDELVSSNSSLYASPVHSPDTFRNDTLDFSHPSALNLSVDVEDEPIRPITPSQGSSAQSLRSGSPSHNLSRVASSQTRIRTLNDRVSDERLTYNGNRINLEDEPKE